jgi:hypothetical protein
MAGDQLAKHFWMQPGSSVPEHCCQHATVLFAPVHLAAQY